MAVTVHISGPRGSEKIPHDAAVDENGNLIVTAREGRGERSVAVYAAGARGA